MIYATDVAIHCKLRAFYDILIHLRDKYNFEYGEDKNIGGLIINDKCKALAKKIKELIDVQSSFTDWLNNTNVRAELNQKIFFCLVKAGYSPQYNDEVFEQVMEQVENFKNNESVNHSEVKETTTPVMSMYAPMEEESGLMMVAEDIFVYGSIPIDLPDTKRVDLIDEKLNLILMYAIGNGARQKTETAGKIALGIKESVFKDEQMAAYKSVKYLMFHYWSNPKTYELTSEPMFVDKDAVPSDYLIRLEKDAVKFLLLEYNPHLSTDLGGINLLKTQRRGGIRYLPFVTTLESIKDE